MDAKTATSRRTMRPSKSSGFTTRIEETCYPGTSSYSACNPRAGRRTRHTKVYVEKEHGYDNSFHTHPTARERPMTCIKIWTDGNAVIHTRKKFNNPFYKERAKLSGIHRQKEFHLQATPAMHNDLAFPKE